MFLAYLSVILLLLAGLFLIFIVLLQRGRGGGLVGALGGMGGQSAFGTKAGDVFTKITVVVVVIWVGLVGASAYALRSAAKSGFPGGNPAPAEGAIGPAEKTESETESKEGTGTLSNEPPTGEPAGPHTPAETPAGGTAAKPAGGDAAPKGENE